MAHVEKKIKIESEDKKSS